jgi:hypothetical protein
MLSTWTLVQMPGASESRCIRLPCEPVLDGVNEEDRNTVRDVIYVVHALKSFASWSVTPRDHYYEVVALTDPKSGAEITWHELDLIKTVNRMRIDHLSVQGVVGQPGALSLVLHIMRKSEPVAIEEYEILRVQKKRRFYWGS